MNKTAVVNILKPESIHRHNTHTEWSLNMFRSQWSKTPFQIFILLLWKSRLTALKEVQNAAVFKRFPNFFHLLEMTVQNICSSQRKCFFIVLYIDDITAVNPVTALTRWSVMWPEASRQRCSTKDFLKVLMKTQSCWRQRYVILCVICSFRFPQTTSCPSPFSSLWSQTKLRCTGLILLQRQTDDQVLLESHVETLNNLWTARLRHPSEAPLWAEGGGVSYNCGHTG